jgi:hypothetical protein
LIRWEESEKELKKSGFELDPSSLAGASIANRLSIGTTDKTFFMIFYEDLNPSEFKTVRFL